MKRRIRVLHVIDSLDLGGAQSVLINLVKYGDRSRFEFEVATMHGRGVYWDSVLALGIKVRSLSFDSRVPLFVPALLWLYLTRRYDIVHAHLIGANAIAKPLAALCGVKVRINHDHCNDKEGGPSRWVAVVDKLHNRYSTHVIAVSDSTRAYAIDKEGLEPDRVTTIHNGIDLDIYRTGALPRDAARARWNLPQDAFVVAGIGRLSFQKNFSLFLDAAAAVLKRHPEAYFVIAGTGAEEAQLKARADRLDIRSRLRFLGYVANMTELYPAVDMLMLTSRYEGLPITVLEAMATGIVIVSSRLDGVQEVLVDGVDGALVTPGNAAEFSSAVCDLIEQPGKAQRYRAAALAKVQAGYSAQAMSRAVDAIYNRYLPQEA